jgi:hypothetical protein
MIAAAHKLFFNMAVFAPGVHRDGGSRIVPLGRSTNPKEYSPASFDRKQSA